MAQTPGKVLDSQEQFPPPGYFVWAQARNVFQTFPLPSGVIAITTNFTKSRNPHSGRPWVLRIEKSDCQNSFDPPGLPDIGIVNLSRDPQRRWGTREGGSQADHNIANAGLRSVIGAGVFHDGKAWLAFQTEANPSVVDVYVEQSGTWKLEWSSYPNDTTWATATSTNDGDGVVALVKPRRARGRKPVSGWNLSFWNRSGRSSHRRLELALSPSRVQEDRFILSGTSNGASLVGACDETGAVIIEQLSTGPKTSHIVRATDFRPCAEINEALDCPQLAKRYWGGHALTPTQVRVWQSTGATFDFECSPDAEKCVTKSDAATSALVAQALPFIKNAICGIEITADGTVVLNTSHNNWHLLGNRPLNTACPSLPNDRGGF
jgi:hypothetical protein